jgi:aspartate aminotransferase
VGDDDLAAPLERFAALHARSRRSAIDLAYPNPRVARDPRAFDLLREVVDGVQPEDLQYTPLGGGPVVRRRIAGALNRQFGLGLGHRDIVLTPGATAALVVALTALFRPGDEILVVTPCWMDYPLYLRRAGLSMTTVAAGPGKRLDAGALAAACGPRTAGVLISQPACPTGVLHGEDDLRRLAGALTDHGRTPTLLSDEVHRDQVWDGSAVRVPMQFYPHTASVYSFGKAWGLQGQRTGYLALGPGLAELAPRVERAMRSTGFGAPTALMQRLVTRIADLVPDVRSLGDDQRWIRGRLTESGYRVVAAQGSAFVYVQCPDGADDEEFVTRLAAAGVLAMPSSVFHERGCFRLALNTGRAELTEAARRLGTLREQT